MIRKIAFCSFALCLAQPALAQVADPQLDGRSRLIDYLEGHVIPLDGAPGYALMIDLSPDEQIENVALGDTNAWQVSVAKAGNRLFVKPIQAASDTNMTVVTSVRTYLFDLRAGASPSEDMAYTVAFRYPAPAVPGNDGYVDVAAVERRLSRYKISGDRLIRPSSVSDDGARTYIIWPRTSPIPAVYAIDDYGRTKLVNGMMDPNDVYVVDGVPLSLKFQLDQSAAFAKRISPRKGH